MWRGRIPWIKPRHRVEIVDGGVIYTFVTPLTKVVLATCLIKLKGLIGIREGAIILVHVQVGIRSV
jgi:hypothetical protein